MTRALFCWAYFFVLFFTSNALADSRRTTPYTPFFSLACKSVVWLFSPVSVFPSKFKEKFESAFKGICL